ncbi:unnamed protein product [Closterium sp. NIES-65]|nr:unnamed protein product [Closterium sp. NIES-65]
MLTMTMTASLTACSEEACGGGGGTGGGGGVDLMDAEVPAVMDIDWEDRRNPLAATAYVRDIYALYRRMERETMAAESYMSQQADINDKMRAILLDWLIEVHLKFKLMPETLFLTANLIDRYLSLAPVRRRNLQLVGVTAMLIASKYEEIWAPEVRDFVYISDNAYSRAEVIALEKDMLNALRFQLTADLQPCVRMMAELQHKAGRGNLTAVYKKYSNPKFGEVAKLPHVSVPTLAPGQ